MPHNLYPVPHCAVLSPTESQVSCEKEGRGAERGSGTQKQQTWNRWPKGSPREPGPEWEGEGI